MRRRVMAAVVVSLLGGAAMAPGASASCAVADVREQVRGADGALIGVVEAREGDVLTIRVTRLLKGAIGERVQVRDAAPMTSVSLSAQPGETIGLVLRARDGGWEAHDCDRADVRRLRAMARGEAPCPGPHVKGLRLRRAGGLAVTARVRVFGRFQRPDRVIVRWGDGRRTVAAVRATGRQTGVAVVRHRYRRSGRYLVRATPQTTLEPGCGSRPRRGGTASRRAG